MPLSETDRSGLFWLTATSSTGGACVQVAPITNGVAVRDSKDPEGPILLYTAAEWKAFLDGAKKGEFDHLI